MIIYQYK